MEPLGARVYRVIRPDGEIVGRHLHAVPALAQAERLGLIVDGSDGCLVWSADPVPEGDHWVDTVGPMGVGGTEHAVLRSGPRRLRRLLVLR